MKFLQLLSLIFISLNVSAQQNINSLTTKDIKVNGNLEVNSTVSASKPCPVMTEAQRNAITSPQSGRCVYNSNTNQLNIFNGTIWKSAGGGISNWETAFNYAINDVVIESNKIYQCNTAHTSTVFASDIANWTLISDNLPVDLTTDVGASVLPMANGGSDKALTPTLGGVVYTDANSMEVLGAGTSGQVLKSNGAAAPTWQDSSNKLQGEKQSEVSFTKLKARNRSVTQTGAGEYLLGDQENLLENGNSEASTLLQGWTCTNSGDFSAETTEPLDGNKSLKVQPLTVGGYTCYQDFNINQFQRGQSVLLSAMVRASGSDTLQICYRENGVVTSICSQAVSNGIPATEAVIGSSATSIGYQFTIPYNSLGLVVRMDKFDMRYGTAVTNQPVQTNFMSYGAIPTPTATTTNPTKGASTITDNVECRQDGPQYECNYRYYQTSAGTAGSGGYIFSLPTGIEFDPTIIFQSNVASYSYNGAYHRSVVGWCSGDVSGGGMGSNNGLLIATSATTFQCYAWANGGSSTQVVGAGFLPFSSNPMGIQFTLRFKGKGLASSVPTYTGRCNDPRACETVFSAKVSAAGVVTSENLDFINGNAVITNTATYDLTFNTSLFSVAPSCTVSAVLSSGADSTNIGDRVVSISNTNYIYRITGSGAPLAVPAEIVCQRQGQDYINAKTLQQNVALKEYPKLSIPSTSSGSEQIRAEYGATINTACTTGTCAYLNQTGTSVTSIAKNGGAGAYRMTLTRTYSKLLCIVNSQASGVVLNPVKASCSNCSTIDFQTYYSSNADSFGMIDCLGTY